MYFFWLFSTLYVRFCVFQNLERIIVRDFFPDHGQLKDQKDYLEAEDKKDFEKMREIALKYSTGHRSKDKSDMPGITIKQWLSSNEWNELGYVILFNPWFTMYCF